MQTRGTSNFLCYSVDRKWKDASNNPKPTEEFYYMQKLIIFLIIRKEIYFQLSVPDTCYLELQLEVFREYLQRYFRDTLESILKGNWNNSWSILNIEYIGSGHFIPLWYSAIWGKRNPNQQNPKFQIGFQMYSLDVEGS